MESSKHLSVCFEQALTYAFHLHQHQERKGNGVPYIAHLLGVCSLVLEAGGSENQAIAALLHDAVEDQGGRATLDEIRSRFGDEVAGIVDACSDSDTQPKPPWRERKEEYLKHLPNAPQQALLVSLADKLYNANSIWRDLQVTGDDTWKRFNGKKRGTRWYYHKLDETYRRIYPGSLADEFHEVVEKIRAFPENKSGAAAREREPG